MRSKFKAVVLASVALVLLSSTVAAQASLQVVTTFNKGDFPESLAADGQGNLYASLGFIGNVVRVTPAGQQQTVAHLDVGSGLLTGLAFDSTGVLYVNDATFSASLPPAVYRIDPDGTTAEVASLPATSFPNGLAFHGGYMYVSDSSLATIWRAAPGGQLTPWLVNSLFAPKISIGANGIAFWRDDLYVSVADSGAIIRVPVNPDGTPGSPQLVIQDNSLRTADGIAFDAQGNLYVAVNANRLMKMSPTGELVQLAAKNDGLAYPSMPDFGIVRGTRTTLFVSNGALSNGTPDIVSLDVGVRGLPLPA